MAPSIFGGHGRTGFCARGFQPAPHFARVLTSFALLALAGCASTRVEPSASVPDPSAQQYDARTLADPGLRQFLRDDLGHDVATWDFETLCWVGFYYHPSLELARAQWQTTLAAEQTAGARPNPTLSLAPGYDFTRQAGVTPWMPGVSLDLPIETNGKRGHRQDIARAEAKAARLGVFNAAWQLRGELRRALLDAGGAQRRQDVLQRQTQRQQMILTLLEQRFAAGSIASSEVALMRTALLRAEVAAADAGVQLATARTRVAAAIGLPVRALAGITLPVPPAMPMGDLAAARQESLRSRPDILAALARYQSAEAALELEVAKQLPDVHFGPAYQYDQGQNKWSLGISFEIPLFNHNAGPIAEAKSRRAEAAAQFNVLQAQVIADIEAATAAMAGTASQRERLLQAVDLARNQAAMARQRAQLGSADALEVANAEVDEAVANGALAEAEIASASATGQLEDALRLPFPQIAALADSSHRADRR